MDTKKTPELLQEETVKSNGNNTRLLAAICWALARQCLWPEKQFAEKLNKEMVQHTRFLLALEPDSYTAYQNCCCNILRFAASRRHAGARFEKRNKENNRACWQAIFGQSSQVLFAPSKKRYYLPEALLEIIETPAREVLAYWMCWLRDHNRKQELTLLYAVAATVLTENKFK